MDEFDCGCVYVHLFLYDIPIIGPGGHSEKLSFGLFQRPVMGSVSLSNPFYKDHTLSPTAETGTNLTTVPNLQDLLHKTTYLLTRSYTLLDVVDLKTINIQNCN